MRMANTPAGYYKKVTIFTLVFALFVVFVSQNTYWILALAAMLSFLFVTDLVIEGRVKNSAIIFFIFYIVVLLPGFLSFNASFSKYFYIWTELLTIYFAYKAGQNGTLYLKYLKILFYLFVLFVFYNIFKYWGLDEPLSYIVQGSSQNGIPSYAIILLVSLLIANYVKYDELQVFPCFLVLLIAYYGEGRGSIVISFLITLVVLGINAKTWLFNKKPSPLLVSFTFFIIFIASGILIDDVFNFVVTNTKLSVGLGDSHRYRILMDYIGNLDMLEWVIGGSYEGTVIDSQYNGNPHIALVRTHYFFGLIPVLLFTLTPLLFLVWKVSIKTFVMSVLALLAIGRSISEPILFPTYLDFFYLTPFFMYYFSLDENHNACGVKNK
ncbi:hypothetical protein [Saccharospirillum sp.]|uniref:hypothetical protein n=2 Tax=Saccharospirillum sp. TaxID=2033801 RepID=UPI00329944A0